MSTSELAASYAALILADDGVEITVSASTTPRRNAAQQGKKVGRPSEAIADWNKLNTGRQDTNPH